MTKKLSLILIIAITVFASCSSGGGTKEEVVSQFITLIGEKNYEGALEFQKNEAWSDADKLANSQEFGSIDGVEILKISAQNDKDGMAVVFAEVTYQNAETGDETKTQNFYLKKFGGAWKIVKVEPATGENITNNEKEEGNDNTNNNTGNYDWNGNYTYEYEGGTTAGGTPIWGVYELKITGNSCTVVANGYQLFVNLECTGKNNGNSYEVYVEKNIESMFDYEKGQLLFTLKYENGKIVTYDNKFLYEDEPREYFIKEKSDEAVIADIKSKFQKINDELASYRVVTKDIENGSEGGQITAYYDGGEIKRISAVTLSSMGRFTNDYYFWDNVLFFVFSVDGYYSPDNPMSGDIVEKYENRYYFNKTKIIKWLDKDKKEVASSKFAEKEDEISKTISQLKSML